MKLMQLKQYSINEFDKSVIDRMCKDSDLNLNKYVINVICDLLQHIPMEETLKVNAKNNINTYDEKSIGEIATYISLIPYVQIKLKDKDDGVILTSSLIEMLISYIVGYVTKEAFNKNILEIKSTLQLSEVFYCKLVHYFINNRKYLVEEINKII